MPLRMFDRYFLSEMQEKTVQVYTINVKIIKDFSPLQRLLPADEIALMRQIRQPKARVRYLYGHALLRIILASCCGTAPRDLEFERGLCGKPSLKTTTSHEGLARLLSFNLSESSDYVCVAVGNSVGPIGVDVEQCDPTIDAEALAGRFFSSAEHRGLMSLKSSKRPAIFTKIWTRKEAVMKCSGRGLSLPSRSFCIWTGCLGHGPSAIDWSAHEGVLEHGSPLLVETIHLRDDTFVSLAWHDTRAKAQFLELNNLNDGVRVFESIL